MNLRILLISHNPMNLNENNGRTLRNLLSEIDAERISHLFFHEGEIDAPFCHSFYRITDFDIKNSLLHFRKAGGVVDNIDGKEDLDNKKKYAKHCEKKPFMRFIRDFAWGLNSWKSKKLKEWLRNENPNIIFFYSSDSVFCHRIARWIKKYLNLPMFIYWVDDFYLKLKNSSSGFFSFVNNKKFLHIAKKNILTSHNACITPKMAKAYEKEFNKPFSILFNSSMLEPFKAKQPGTHLVISYLGNIGLGRCDPLLRIGELIDEYNLPIEFNIYSAENREYLLNKITSSRGLNFKGQVSYEKVLEIMKNSDALLHVEDFASKNIEFCKYSLSTKIADCLACNRCLICYGPIEVASIEYLKESNCALVATDDGQMLEILKQIVNDKNIIQSTANRALNVYQKNHMAKQNTLKLKELLLESF